MTKKTALAFPAILTMLCACAALKPASGLAPVHPQQLDKGRPTCTECHKKDKPDIPIKTMDHTVLWLEDHRFAAYQRERVCAICHAQSFCYECHETTRVELKPSIRRETDTYRRFPHRGDYLTRHRFDAEIDPTSCIRCHGNPKGSKTCNNCHGSSALIKGVRP